MFAPCKKIVTPSLAKYPHDVFWFWFWVTHDSLALLLNIVWWIVVVRLTKRTWLRILVSVFMGGQILAFLLLVYDAYLPKPMLIALIVWHCSVLPLSVAALFLLATTWAYAWVRQRRSTPGGSATASPSALTRREFIAACATVAPPLFTIGASTVALAQLSQFRIQRFSLAIPTLPRALDGMTIAHVSDMHVGRLTSSRMLRQMVNATNGFKADLVVMTGDLIHYKLAALSEAIPLAKTLEGRYGLWMIQGNHDLFDDGPEFDRRVKAAGLRLLLDESAVTDVRGHPVQLFGLRWLVGHDLPRDRVASLQVRRLMKQRQPDAFPILLAHHPHAFDAAAAANLPLTLAGHTHGGQWMLNSRVGVGPILFRYWTGHYMRGGSQMIVSNGIGNVFPVRVNAPAELGHITLRCG
jgi:uncharacterized protein